jgi:putative flippase GtrA
MKFIKYLFVGGAAAIVDIGLFYLGAGILGWNYLLVGACSFTLATVVNYVLSVRLVFQSGVRFSRHHEVALVFLISGAGLLLNQLILYICISQHILGLFLAKLAATGGVFFWNYFMRSRIVFSPSDRAILKP